MSDTENTVAVLFADICGSTALFEESGNLRALGMIGECLDELASVAHAQGGDIIRSKGDDVLCTFTDVVSALRAATRMSDYEVEGGLQVHVAIHRGPVINARGDIFGDVVNVAARLLSLANPGEILVSDDFAAALPEVERRSLRLLEHRAMKGKSEPMGIYSVFVQDSEATQFYLETGERTAKPTRSRIVEPPRARITLSFQGREITRNEGHAVFVLGRSSSCDLVVAEPCVSREHAAIRVGQGKALLTDRSSTGTYIETHGERAVLVRRETVPLIGAGTLSLGRRPTPDDTNVIRFLQTFEG